MVILNLFGLFRSTRLLLILTLLLSLALSSAASAVNPFTNPGPVVQKFGLIRGESVGRINKIIQDKAGFLWLATIEGLLRFDGHTLKTFRHDPLNANSLPHNHVSGALQDDQGFIWLLTIGGGLSRFEPHTEQFVNFSHEPNDPETLSGNILLSIVQGADNKLWIGSTKGLNLFDQIHFKNQRLDSHMQPAKTDNDNVVKSILLDNNQLWLSVIGKGLYRHDLASGQSAHFNHDSNKAGSLDSNFIFTLYKSQDGQLWVGSKAGLSRYQPDSQTFTAIDVNHNSPEPVEIRNIYQDSAKRIWLATRHHGIRLIYPDSQTPVAFSSSDVSGDAFGTIYAKSIIEDASGAIWFSAGQKGLFKLNAAAMLFDYFDNQSKSDFALNAFYRHSNGVLWLAMANHLYKFDEKNKRIIPIVQDIGLVVSISEDQNRQLVLVIQNKGAVKLDLQTTQLSPYFSVSHTHPLAPTNKYRIYGTEQQGRVWGQIERGNSKGLFSYDPHTTEFIQHLHNQVIEDFKLVDDHVLATTLNKGLHVYSQPTGQWSKVSHGTQGLVFDIYQDSKRRIWLTTVGLGLAQLDLTNLSLNYFTTKDGLPTNEITAVVEDKNALLWLATPAGMVRFNPDSKQVDQVDYNHGLRLGKIFPARSIALSSGNILLINKSGMVVFSPQQVTKMLATTADASNILFSDFRLFNQPVKLAHQSPASPLTNIINQTDQLTLSYADQLFSIAFSSSNYGQHGTIRYAYQMVGFSEQWIETDIGSQVATFTALPSDEYLFKVKSSRADGTWHDNYRNLKITITPPIWATTGAYILYLVVAVSLILLVNHIRTRRFKLRAAQLEKGIEERTRELKERADTITGLLDEKARLFTNVSHEFRTPLTLILNPIESWLKSTPDEASTKKLAMMKRNAVRLLKMVDQLLALSSTASEAEQEYQRYDVTQTLNLLASSFQPLFEAKHITFQISQVDVPTLALTADSLDLILTNLLSNAIKYTREGGLIKVTVALVEGHASISVSDNGIGISKENQAIVFNRFTRARESHGESIPGAGIGLALVKELVEINRGTIRLSSEAGKGSTFTLELPLPKTPQSQLSNSTPLLSSSSQLEIEALSNSPSTISTDIQTEAQEALAKQTVLLIDDNADMLTLLTDTLEPQFSCIRAADGEQGLAMGLKYIPDIIICDVMMPGISGFEVARQFKEMELCCHIPLLLLTAKGDKNSRMTGWQHDIDEYLTKPFDADELIVRVNNLLSIRSLLKSRYSQSLIDPDVAKTMEKSTKGLSEKDHQFVEKLKKHISEQYHNPNFSRNKLAKLMTVSDRQLYRKLNAILEQNFVDYLRKYRLGQAAKLLKTDIPISQVFEQVGFSSFSYFSSCFKAEFGMTPKQYQNG